MELKYIEQLTALPNTILTEPIGIAIENADIDIMHIDVGDFDESSIADFSKYDYKIICVLISVFEGSTRISIHSEKYAPKEKNL